MLTLVREGLTNQQIAERLGTSFDAAKYHVAEILSKLHLSTREEAAAWRPAPPERPVLRPAWAAGAAAIILAMSVGFGVLLYAVLKSDNSDDDDNLPTTSATVSPTGDASLTSSPPPVADAIPLTMTDGIGLQEGLVLILETGCTGCDGPSTSLLRVYRDTDGTYVSDILFTPATVGLEPRTVQTEKGPQEDVPTIAGFAMLPDASQIVVNVTYTYELGGGSIGSTLLFESTDGGVTWSDFGSLDAGEFMLSDIIGGEVIAGRGADSGATVAPSTTPYYPPGIYRLYPSGDPIPTPPGADGTWSPIRLSDDTIGWATSDGRILDSDGGTVLQVDGQFTYAQRSFNPPDGVAVVWSPGGGGLNYLQVQSKSSGTYLLPGFAVPGVWATGDLAVVGVGLPEPSPPPTGGFSFTVYPALLDPKDGTVQPIIHPFGDEGFEHGRNTIDAVMIGPRALVTGTGSCLNVRSEPSESAAVVECVADGVLLANLGAENDPAWRHVRTPSGKEGYASADYLHIVSEPASQS